MVEIATTMQEVEDAATWKAQARISLVARPLQKELQVR